MNCACTTCQVEICEGQVAVADDLELSISMRLSPSARLSCQVILGADDLVIVQVFGVGGTFASGDTYTINETIQLYAVTDDIFDLTCCS